MQWKIINAHNFSLKDIDFCVQKFLKGKVAVLPAETIYGFSCLASCSAAIEKIFILKKRPRQKPFLLLAADIDMIKKYSFLTAYQEKFLRQAWQNGQPPLTTILASQKKLPLFLEKEGEIAWRIPAANDWGQNFLIPLIKKIGAPLVSTSLNISGEKNFLEEDLPQVKSIFPTVDFVVEARGKEFLPPSRLVRWQGKEIIYLR